MAGPNRGGDDSPDLSEALEGAAHLGDMVRLLVEGDDPEMRNKVGLLDNISVMDAVRAAGSQVQAEERYPHTDLRDTASGVEVLVDTTDTPVVASNLTVKYEPGDNAVTIFEPQAEYRVAVTTSGPVAAAEVASASSGIATVEVEFDGGNPDYEASEAASDGSDGEAPEESQPDETSEEPSVGGGGSPEITLNELLETNPTIRMMLESQFGEAVVSTAESMYGDQPVSEIPLEDLVGDADAESEEVDDEGGPDDGGNDLSSFSEGVDTSESFSMDGGGDDGPEWA